MFIINAIESIIINNNNIYKKNTNFKINFRFFYDFFTVISLSIISEFTNFLIITAFVKMYLIYL